MPDITCQIGAFDAATRTVSVTFTGDAVEHRRAVNACLDADGAYDAAATAARIEAVAAGVAAKIAAGAIGRDPADMPAPPPPAPDGVPLAEAAADPAAADASLAQPAPRKRRSVRSAPAA